MIVHDFHVSHVAVRLRKTEAILVVDANAVLFLPVAFERFEAIARKSGQILEGFRFVECREFPLTDPFDNLIFPGELVVEELLGFGVPKRGNHVYSG